MVPRINGLFRARAESPGDQTPGQPSAKLQCVDRTERPATRPSAIEIARPTLFLRLHQRQPKFGKERLDPRRASDAAGRQFHRAVVGVQRAQHATEPLLLLDQRHRYASPGPIVRGSHAGESAADDGDRFHIALEKIR